MREITRSVKVALKCLIAAVLVDVDLPHWTSKVDHLVAFAAIVSNILLPVTSGKSFGDLATFSVDILHFICWMSFDSPTPISLQSAKFWATWRRFRLIFAFYKLRVRRISNWGLFYLLRQVWSWYGHPLPSIAFLLLTRCLTLWPWPALIHGWSRDQHC